MELGTSLGKLQDNDANAQVVQVEVGIDHVLCADRSHAGEVIAKQSKARSLDLCSDLLVSIFPVSLSRETRGFR